jgi:hypothetical protein
MGSRVESREWEAGNSHHGGLPLLVPKSFRITVCNLRIRYLRQFPMLLELFPFSIEIDPVGIAGGCLWALALYLGLSRLKDRIIELLDRWFNFAERSLYTSEQEFERTRRGREAQNAFYASLFSIVPFLMLGGLSSWGLAITLGRSWAISLGMMACLIAGIYELGRRDGQV